MIERRMAAAGGPGDRPIATPAPPGFLARWIVANAWAELVGLGAVGSIGQRIAGALGEPAGPGPALAFAAVFVVLGALEGLVVGFAQDRVLQRYLPARSGWVRATVVGAMVAWALGMIPSTLMSALPHSPAASPPEIGHAQRLLLAAALGALAGPLLAFFQWRRLRLCLQRGAGWWLPANGAAWALGMPLVFVGAHVAATGPGAPTLVVVVALSLLATGAVVGAVHGLVLARLIASQGAVSV